MRPLKLSAKFYFNNLMPKISTGKQGYFLSLFGEKKSTKSQLASAAAPWRVKPAASSQLCEL